MGWERTDEMVALPTGQSMKPKPKQRSGGDAALDYEVIPTRGGVRLLQHGTVLSEVRSSPGPTHSVVDVIAAVLQALEAGPRVAMLGFAGGGTLAPLRAMGGAQAVDAVDLDDSGWRLFRRLCDRWAGVVRFQRAEACAWLRCNRCRYDAVIEDLSIVRDSDVFKPAATWSELPPLVHRRLRRGGVAIFNLVPPAAMVWPGETPEQSDRVGCPEQGEIRCLRTRSTVADGQRGLGAMPLLAGTLERRRSRGASQAPSPLRSAGAVPNVVSWSECVGWVVRDGWASRVVHFADYENRLVIVGRCLPVPRELSRRVRVQLEFIGSRLASRIAVRHG